MTNQTNLILGDGLIWLEQCPPASLDLILTDPPYSSLDKHRTVGTTTRLGGASIEANRRGWFDTISNDDIYDFLCHAFRALKKDAHLWMLCDGETAGYIQGFVREGETGFKYVKQFPIIKCAASGGVKQGTGYHGRATVEYAVLCEKGRRKFTDESWPDFFTPVWDGSSDSRQYTPDGEKYDTAKPVSLLERLIEISSAPGDLVCDPFMGSGSCAQAALQLSRRFVGVDKSERALVTAQNRVNKFYERNQLFHDDAAELSRLRRARLHALPCLARAR